MGWTEIPEGEKEEVREVLCCPKCGEFMKMLVESVPLFGGCHMAYCNNCDSAFIDEGDMPVAKEEEWMKEEQPCE